MSVKLTYGGAIFEVATAREAMELFRLLRSEQSKPRESRIKGSTGGPGERTQDEKRQLTLRALAIIKDAGESGVNSENLANGLGLADTRKLAHIGNILRAFCKRHGFDPETVFTRVETRHGRTWYARKEIDKAIRAAKATGTKESSLL
jgi:hypothetical protein